MQCNLCNIYCPSSYQYDQHIRGRKHAERLSGKSSSSKGRGVCFYWEKGTCYKGSACTFLHTDAGESSPLASAFPNNKKRDSASFSKPTSKQVTTSIVSQSDDEFVADIILCKGVPVKDDPEAKLAPIFRKKSPEKKESRFPEIYRNAFHRKRNVNLYIDESVGVVFEFAYNTTIIEAIKTQIKGRAWNPGMKCWTCPLESLPDAVALYEHMGREVEESIHQRAKALTESMGSAPDSIQMSVKLDPTSKATPESNENQAMTLGSILLKFLYDAEIVAALKKLSPVQRSYEPANRIWTVDVLALPELLEHLGPLGYTPNEKLRDMAKSCQSVQEWLGKALDEVEDQDTHILLEAAMKELVGLVNEAKGSVAKVDRSGCGQAKRRKLLTTSQRTWARKKSGDWDSDSDSDEDSYEDNYEDDDFDVGFDYGYFRRQMQRERKTKPPTDCNCGQPWRTVGGRHVCRYFGTFDCDGCGNRWTSAYCWEGEKQACRGCNRESLPVKKDQLDGRPPVQGGGGGHDSSRCAMCRRLGFSCIL